MEAAAQGWGWSGAEIVAHVMSVESTVIDGAERVLRKEPKRIPLLKRFSLPRRSSRGARSGSSRRFLWTKDWLRQKN